MTVKVFATTRSGDEPGFCFLATKAERLVEKLSNGVILNRGWLVELPDNLLEALLILRSGGRFSVKLPDKAVDHDYLTLHFEDDYD